MSKRVIVGIVLSLLAAGASPALAQNTPFQGLFGAQLAGAPPKSLDLSTSLFSVYDTNLPRLARRDTRGDTSQRDVYYNDLQSGLWYTQRGERTSFSANGTSAVQYYPQLAGAVRWSGAGAVGLSRTGRRLRFGLDQQVRYSPFAHFRVIPVPNAPSGLADVSAPDVALAVSGRESYRYDTSFNASYQLTPRTMFNAGLQHEYLDFVPVEQNDWRRQDANVSLSRSLTPKTAFVVGYGLHRREFQGERVPLRRHDVNMGVNYNNALPFSPRTRLSFSVGTTSMSRVRSATVSTSDTFIRLIGGADLEHQLSRTWQVGVVYNRWVQYIEGVSDVFLADTVTGNLRGYLGPRVELRATSGYSTGPLRFGPRQRAYDTNASTARLRIAMSRGLAAQVEYVHYNYVFSEAVTLPTGIPDRGSRHVFRVGLTTWLPILQ